MCFGKLLSVRTLFDAYHKESSTSFGVFRHFRLTILGLMSFKVNFATFL